MKEQVKATAILVGYIRECAMSGKPDDPAREFADLLAQVTSTNKKIRDAAKSRIKEIARKGGWDPDYGKTKEIDRIGTEQRPRHVDPKFPNRGKRWEESDAEKLSVYWNAGRTLDSIVPDLGRTAGALCAKLAEGGLHGDRDAIRAENVRRGGSYGSLTQTKPTETAHE